MNPPALEAGVDLVAISAAVRDRIPSVIAAAVVGSAVASRGGCVSDIDITALATDVPVGDDRSLEFRCGSWPVHVVSYEPMHFRAVAMRADTLLLFVREIRKLFRGMILFDTPDHWLRRTIDALRLVPMPLHLLQPLHDLVAGARLEASASRLTAYHLIESLAFAWMHLDLSYSYTKSKWLLADAATVPAAHFVPLLEMLADEMVGASMMDELIDEAAQIDPGSGRPAHFFALNRKDAGTLARAGRSREAVFPLRMAAYMLAEERAGAAYEGIASIGHLLPDIAGVDARAASFIRRSLLLECDLPLGLIETWDAARVEFLSHWDRAIQASAAR